MGFRESVQMVIADEATTAQALRDTADMHRSVGNTEQQKVYDRAAKKAEKRAATFRQLLK